MGPCRAAPSTVRHHRLHRDGQDTSYMFVTGPDVIKTVTHEEVTKEDLGGAMTHNAKSASPTRGRGRSGCLALLRELLAYLRRTTWRSRRSSRPTTPRTARRGARHPDPGGGTAPYDMKDLIAAVVDDRASLEVHAPFAQNIVVCSRASAAGASASWPTSRRCSRLSRHRRLGEGCALRPLLRRLQHPARDLRGRARFPARHRAGVGPIIRHGAKLLSPSRRRRCPRSPSSRARRTAAPTA